MTTKTITIMEDAYKALLREKTKGESFTETILRLTKKRGKLEDCFGTWKISDAELKTIEASLSKGWKHFGSHIKGS